MPRTARCSWRRTPGRGWPFRLRTRAGYGRGWRRSARNGGRRGKSRWRCSPRSGNRCGGVRLEKATLEPAATVIRLAGCVAAEEPVDDSAGQVLRPGAPAEAEDAAQPRQQHERGHLGVTDHEFPLLLARPENVAHQPERLVAGLLPGRVRAAEHFLALDQIQQVRLPVEEVDD